MFGLASKSLFKPSALTMRRLVMIAISGAVMGGLLMAAQWALPAWFASPSTLIRIITTLGVIAIAGIAYLALAIATGALDRDELKRALRRRRKTEEASSAAK
jgi:putative peptidoglycan lipid II flippase